jgi:hypothetical protein
MSAIAFLWLRNVLGVNGSETNWPNWFLQPLSHLVRRVHSRARATTAWEGAIVVVRLNLGGNGITANAFWFTFPWDILGQSNFVRTTTRHEIIAQLLAVVANRTK